MRILQLSEQFWPSVGGVQIADSQLAAALAAAGHEVTVITDTGGRDLPPADEYRGVQVRRFDVRGALSAGTPPRLLFELLASVEAIARQLRPDVMHLTSMAGPTLFLAARLAEARGAPPLVASVRREVHPGERTGPDTLLGRVLRRARVVTCVAQRTLEQVAAVCPEVADRLRVVHGGLEDPGPPRDLPAEPALVCLGRLVEGKGFDLAIEVFARLAQRWPRLTLRIAGDGPERAALERLAATLNVEEEVRFLGSVEPAQVPALLASAYLVLLPSRTEGLPLVAIESALAGRAVVAAEVGGMAEVVLDGETGTLVPADDREALEVAIEQLLSGPAEVARRGRAARAWAERRFLLQVRLETYSRLYRSIMDASNE
jgi:glycosyltransferase involved in cell wall biosynthesis